MANNLKRYTNKIALITGTSGIGRAVAITLANEGAQVIGLGIDDRFNQEFDQIATEKNLTIRAMKADVSNSDEVQSAVKHIVKEHGGLDVIVNAAAVHPFGTVVNTSFDIWQRCMNVNIGSIYITAHFGIPHMIARGGGAIVNISSVQGHNCQQNVAAYVATKGAIHALTRAMALDHAGDGIRVNSVSPGSIRTPILSLAAATYGGEGVSEEEAFARFGAAHPLGRIGEPEEVANLVAYLASEDAAFMTGVDVKIDGGLTAGIGVK